LEYPGCQPLLQNNGTVSNLHLGTIGIGVISNIETLPKIPIYNRVSQAFEATYANLELYDIGNHCL